MDVTLNLTDGTYKPYRKPGDTPIYVHIQSNHPPAVKKNIPQNVENRLNMLSCNEIVFNQAKPLYQDALKASGYTHSRTQVQHSFLELNNRNTNNRKNRRRGRRTFWFNPPWDARVAMDVGAKFLRILDRTIPRDHPLHRLFNRHTVKISDRCLANIKKKISTHNHKIFAGLTAEKKRIQQTAQSTAS